MEFLALFIFIYIMYFVMKNVFQKLGFGFAMAGASSTTIFNPLMHIFKFLFKGFQDSGMMGDFEKNKLFSPFNKGLYIDGYKYRLSLKDSFNHLAIVSRTGGGKTTSYVVPNILRLANGNNSFVITDISGELYKQTSSYLASKGYKIYVLNPENLSESIGYNPLYYATDSVKIDELVNILIKSSKDEQKTSDNSEFWDNGAKSLMSILIKILMATNNHKYINLANLRYLINNYGLDGSDLDHLVNTFADDKTYHEFRGFIKGNPQTILSMVTTANIALSPIGINDNLEKLTSSHTINFDDFRKQKTALFIKVPANKQKQYSFLQNIFYSQFFSYMMETLPSKNDLPVFCLLDEFGNLNLPNFETIITTIRKYNVSISIILQSIHQLESKYGKANASTILNGGIASKLFFNGADLPTSEMLSKMMGDKAYIRTKIDGTIYLRDEPVMTIRDIRTMEDDEALFVMTNKLPLKVQMKPYFKDFFLSRYTKRTPLVLNSSIKNTAIEYIDLNYEKA